MILQPTHTVDTVQEPIARAGSGARPPAPAEAGSTLSGGTGTVSSAPPRAGPIPHRSLPPLKDSYTKPTFSKFFEEIRAAFSARFYLLELEAKRAAWSAAYMLAFAVGAALLGVTAWLILVGALIVGAVNLGVWWPIAVVAAIALHVVGVFFLVRGIRSMVENLTFGATRRSLSRSQQTNAPQSETPSSDQAKATHGSSA